MKNYVKLNDNSLFFVMPACWTKEHEGFASLSSLKENNQ